MKEIKYWKQRVAERNETDENISLIAAQLAQSFENISSLASKLDHLSLFSPIPS